MYVGFSLRNVKLPPLKFLVECEFPCRADICFGYGFICDCLSLQLPVLISNTFMVNCLVISCHKSLLLKETMHNYHWRVQYLWQTDAFSLMFSDVLCSNVDFFFFFTSPPMACFRFSLLKISVKKIKQKQKTAFIWKRKHENMKNNMILSIEPTKDYDETQNSLKSLCLICIPEGKTSPLSIYK